MKRQDFSLYMFCVVMFGAIALVIVGDVTSALCDGVDLQKLNEGRPTFGCREFWFNRYQATFVGLISVLAAGVTVYFLAGQNRNAAKQIAMADLERIELLIKRWINVRDMLEETVNLMKNVHHQVRNGLTSLGFDQMSNTDDLQRVWDSRNKDGFFRAYGSAKEAFDKALANVGRLKSFKNDLDISRREDLQFAGDDEKFARAHRFLSVFRTISLAMDKAGEPNILSILVGMQFDMAEERGIKSPSSLMRPLLHARQTVERLARRRDEINQFLDS